MLNNPILFNIFFKKQELKEVIAQKHLFYYYLKSLNNNKINEKDKELLEVFEELKSLSKSIVVYDSNRNRTREIATFAENLDHDCDVKVFDNLKEFIFYIKENSTLIDIACIYISKYNKNIIPKVLAILEKVNIKAILYSDEIEDQAIMKIENLKNELKLAM